MKDRLKALLEKKGWSQRRLAREIGYKPPSVCNWLNGKHSLKGESLIRVAKVFNVSPEWLMTGKETEDIEDEVLNKTGRLGSYHFQINETKTSAGETSIRIAVYPVLGELAFLENFNRYSAKQLRKFVRALKKGLRRLER